LAPIPREEKLRKSEYNFSPGVASGFWAAVFQPRYVTKLETQENQMKNLTKHIAVIALAVLSPLVVSSSTAVDLLQRYPTKLTSGLLEPARARAWQFNPNDIVRVSTFRLEVADRLKVETGPADLGIGHCAG
jgi:hypothetical protein